MKLILEFFNRRPMLYAVVFWVFALFLVAIAVNWLAMPIIAGRFANTMTVPSVVNLPAEEAERVLKKAGLNFKWATEGRYSFEIAANNVMIQIPEAGRTVKENRTIFLTISKGRQEVIVPDLRGASQRQAEISLQRLELVLGSKIEGAHAEIPRGVVIRTEPEVGKKVRIGSRVDLVISSGNSQGKVLLPNLREMSLDKAMETIQSLGFKVGEITAVPHDKKLPNTVLELNPKQGEYLEIGTVIDLTVAE
jgi:serine/threonine-protein kinase